MEGKDAVSMASCHAGKLLYLELDCADADDWDFFVAEGEAEDAGRKDCVFGEPGSVLSDAVWGVSTYPGSMIGGLAGQGA